MALGGDVTALRLVLERVLPRQREINLEQVNAAEFRERPKWRDGWSPIISSRIGQDLRMGIEARVHDRRADRQPH